LRRHEEEDIFGVQICGSYADTVSRAAELIERECTIDFIDLNLGCPIDVVVNKGGGSSLLTKPQRLQEIVKATSASIDTPLTLKVIPVSNFFDSNYYFPDKIAFFFSLSVSKSSLIAMAS
jgi:tRNA-dihydrouridine synthase 3